VPNLKRAVLSLGLVLTGGLTACGGQPPCRPIHTLSFPVVTPRPAYGEVLPAATGTLAVVGDLQRTSFEGCQLGNEVNDDEQRILLADLARQGPLATLLLGDLVFWGESPEHWAYFDHLIARSQLEPRRIFALPGNHDYMLHDELRELKARFPRLARATHDAFTWGGLRLLLLDANRVALGEPAWQRQLAWLDCELAGVARGCSRGVVLFTHQSPFTQSPWAEDDQNLQRDVLPRFCANPRHTAFISAHAHGYERWQHVDVPGCRGSDTPFIVTAGGGGPRPPRRRRGAAHDAAQEHGFSAWPRPFNYLLLKQVDALLRIEVHALEKGETSVDLAETIDVSLPPAPPSGPACECAL